MPNSAHDRDPFSPAPGFSSKSTQDGPPWPSGMDYDPLAAGRGVVFALLVSSVLFGGIVSLVILIWAT